MQTHADTLSPIFSVQIQNNIQDVVLSSNLLKAPELSCLQVNDIVVIHDKEYVVVSRDWNLDLELFTIIVLPL